MSVKRWKETESWGITEGDCMAIMEESIEGEYVLHSDYARLEDEINHLRDCLGDAQAVNARKEFEVFERIEKLKAEVERLRKAGDALVEEGETMAHEVSWVPCVWDNRVSDWNAAKDGKHV